MTRCIGYAASSPPLPRGSATGVKPGLRGLLDAGDPYGEVRTAWHANRNGDEASTGSRVPPSLSDTPSSSQTTSNTNPAHPRSTSWVGRTIARWTPQITNWHISKVTNRRHRSPQQPHQTHQTSSVRVTQLRQLPNPGTALRRETQLGPIGHPSLPTEIHSYLEGSWAGTGLTQLKSGFVPFHRSVGLFPAWGCNPLGRGGCDLIGALIFLHREWPVHRLPGPGIGNDSIPQRRKVSWEKMVGLCSVGLIPIVIPMLRRWLMAPVGSWERHRSGLIRVGYEQTRPDWLRLPTGHLLAG